VSGHLVDKGITLRSGTLVDATIIGTPSSTKNRAASRNPEMSSTKKGNDPIDEEINRIMGMVRARVEHPFRVLKRQFEHVKTLGLPKNRAQLSMQFALGNLFLVRRRLLT
jgi:hypothetical protein